MKIYVYIYAQYDEYDKVYNFHAWGYEMSGQDVGQLVEKREIEFTPPPREVMVNGTIAEYREQQQKIRADAESKVNVLQQRINDLLCIEHKHEPA